MTTTPTDIPAAELVTLAALPAHELIAAAHHRFGTGLALTASFGGAGGMVLLDMAMKISRSIPVLVLDTGLLFEQTHMLIDYCQAEYGIEIVRIKPPLTVEQQAQAHGPELWKRDPDSCCNMRKVRPFADALEPYSAWLTAIRRDQSSTRAATPTIEFDEGFAAWKLCPIATWTGDQVRQYVKDHNLMINPLLLEGYSSIGCVPCTAKPTGDERSGRWAGTAKVECGLHMRRKP